MPSEQPHRKPHIYLGPTGRAEPYTSPSTGRRPKPDIPPRNRQEHGSNLFSYLRRVQEQQDTLLQEAGTYELRSRLGIQVEFESFTWHKNAPVKPEVVFEGGNVVRDDYGCAWTPSLSLLTTHHKPGERLFTTFRATSAATALAARFAAQIQLQYPDFWPETVRALMVHSAEWTDEMLRQFATGANERQQAHHRVRCVGFGVPNLERALWSANNTLALIVEDRLQPFEKRDGRIVTRDMHLHDLPWPRQSLEELGEVDVEMTVTLSYFIEPNPSSRVVSGKYSYQSHGLRFDVRRSLESEAEFRSRINRQAREEEEGSTTAPSDPDWLFGPRFRHKGSVHKDIWRGKAVELAERSQIAVYPAMGWWRTRTSLERYEKDARYSLVVTIAAPEVEVDLYNEIAAQVVIV